MKGSDVIVKMLKLYGASVIFGYPGASVLDIYNSIRNENLTHVLSATENGAVTAADGYARATHGLGIVLATSGPGASNLITGLAAANLDGSALLAITGNVPSTSLGTDSFQEVDTSGIAMPITKYSHIVKIADTLPNSLAETMSIALRGRKGAVLIDIPQDVQQAEIDISEDGLYDLLIKHGLIEQDNDNRTETVTIPEIGHAIDIINAATKPIILVGGGVRLASAEREATILADKINCPVVTTLMGVSLYDNTRPNYFGLTGVYGNPTANHALKNADVIISLGVRFNDRLRATGCLENKQIIQLDIDDAENGKTIAASIYIKGDLKATIPPLTQAIKAKDGKFARSMTAHRIKVGRGDNNRRERNAYAVINEILNDCDIVTTDVGTHQMALAKNYSLKGTFLTNGGLGAMGWGLGAAIGAIVSTMPNNTDINSSKKVEFTKDNHAFKYLDGNKYISNNSVLDSNSYTSSNNALDSTVSLTTNKGLYDKKCVLISGDGSFNMEMQELITAVSLALPLIIVIFNNNSLEMFRHVQEERFGYEYMARPTVKVDYVMLARSMGACGIRAKTIKQLRDALNSFKGTPLVIDFVI